MKLRRALGTAAIGAVLAISPALSAQAETRGTDATFSTFVGSSTNGATSASVKYRYWSQGGDWYGIEYQSPTSGDNFDWWGDGWGGILVMHYDGYGLPNRQEPIAMNKDGSSVLSVGDTLSNVKNVWFEVCNYNWSTEQRASCQRLHKA